MTLQFIFECITWHNKVFDVIMHGATMKIENTKVLLRYSCNEMGWQSGKHS